MIKYDRFWETLKKKGISQYNLVTDYNLSKSLLQRLRNNEGISTHSIKKKTAVLMFALALSLSVVGCGNSAEPKQEEPQETRQELDYDDVVSNLL